MDGDGWGSRELRACGSKFVLNTVLTVWFSRVGNDVMVQVRQSCGWGWDGMNPRNCSLLGSLTRDAGEGGPSCSPENELDGEKACLE